VGSKYTGIHLARKHKSRGLPLSVGWAAKGKGGTPSEKLPTCVNNCGAFFQGHWSLIHTL